MSLIRWQKVVRGGRHLMISQNQAYHATASRTSMTVDPGVAIMQQCLKDYIAHMEREKAAMLMQLKSNTATMLEREEALRTMLDAHKDKIREQHYKIADTQRSSLRYKNYFNARGVLELAMTSYWSSNYQTGKSKSPGISNIIQLAMKDPTMEDILVKTCDKYGSRSTIPQHLRTTLPTIWNTLSKMEHENNEPDIELVIGAKQGFFSQVDALALSALFEFATEKGCLCIPWEVRFLPSEIQ